jgi:hypothetical protein
MLVPGVVAASPVTYRATGAITSITGSTSTFVVGGSYVLDLTFDPAVPTIGSTATEAYYDLTAISFNYGSGAYVAGTTGSFVGSTTARNNNFFTGDQVFFKAGAVSGFGPVEGRTFLDDQRILDLSDKAAGSWASALALPTLTLDMFDDILLGDYTTLDLLWGEDDFLIVSGNVLTLGLAPTTVVPLPAAFWLFAGGLAMLAPFRRRAFAD